MRHSDLRVLGLVALTCLFAQGATANEEKATETAKAPAVEAKDAAPAKAEAAVAEKAAPEATKAGEEAPEAIVFDKAKLGPVKFDHKAHSEINGGCAACHEGKEPIFKKERSKEVLKMAEMNAGKSCGACHDGKKLNKDGKPVFATKGACMKCHKKGK